MVKAIIFDCFGVLVTSSYEPFKAHHLHGDKNLIKAFMTIEDRSSRGEISLEQAEQEFADLAGLSFQETSAFLQDNPRNALLLRFIAQELRGVYKLSVLSNIADDRMEELFTDEDIAMFDDMVLSFQVGLAKPDARIFELAAERLGVQPEACLFVDDNDGYCDAAQAVGMQTILYRSFKQFVSDFKQIS